MHVHAVCMYMLASTQLEFIPHTETLTQPQTHTHQPQSIHIHLPRPPIEKKESPSPTPFFNTHTTTFPFSRSIVAHTISSLIHMFLFFFSSYTPSIA
jgi:hypothetical protein